MDGYEELADCTIRLEIPKRLDSVEAPTATAHLFQQGILDDELYRLRKYTDVSDYLRDKLTVVGLVHEMGHAIGLAHTKDPACVMTAAPRGSLSFCGAELTAARRRIDIAAHAVLAD